MSFASIHITKRRAFTKGTLLLNTLSEYASMLRTKGAELVRLPAPLDQFVKPIQQYLTFKRVGVAFLVFYVLFVFLALKILQREHLQSPVPGTYIRNTYSFKPRRPLINVSATTDCHANGAEVRKPYFYRLDDNTYFTNAYFDKRQGGPYIRILSLRQNNPEHIHTRRLYCLINSALNHSLIAVPADVHILHDNNDNEYGGYILTCNARDILYDNPCKVRISYERGLSDQLVTIPLVTLNERYFYATSFALCTPPIHGVVTQTQLVEFVELNRLLGAEHFYFYLYMGNPRQSYLNPNVEQVLQHYISAGLVTVFPWQLPIEPERYVWSHAKALAMQHCLYTNMWKYKYLVFNDLDEFLIPHSTNSWSAMMDSIDKEGASGYCAQSAYFPPDVTQSLRTLHSFKRTETINTKHTKCIIRPERVFDMGSDGINKAYDENWPMAVVDQQVALVHHYKWCTTDWDFHNCFDFVTDECVGRYEEQLEENFRNTMLVLAGKSVDTKSMTTYTSP
ncbi:hypothetical protein LSH36_207g03000 [Paralvinella palmiformis]|uniref:Glycosyltransferase family 92 protein n=1 Tax=Paralvinella palmiformis TaxID=53620 RepID=A0AAD9N4R0_9ANNE|nr:hypothetical protein LSH36_207g03000 [Paralvinella palmiformis]